MSSCQQLFGNFFPTIRAAVNFFAFLSAGRLSPVCNVVAMTFCRDNFCLFFYNSTIATLVISSSSFFFACCIYTADPIIIMILFFNRTVFCISTFTTNGSLLTFQSTGSFSCNFPIRVIVLCFWNVYSEGCSTGCTAIIASSSIIASACVIFNQSAIMDICIS